MSAEPRVAISVTVSAAAEPILEATLEIVSTAALPASLTKSTAELTVLLIAEPTLDIALPMLEKNPPPSSSSSSLLELADDPPPPPQLNPNK